MLHFLIRLKECSAFLQVASVVTLSSSHMLPIVISETLAHPFSFYLQTSVFQGIRYQGELYGLINEFKGAERLKAYQRACEWVERGMTVIITASGEHYAIWMSLRSPACFPILISQKSSAIADQLVYATDA